MPPSLTIPLRVPDAPCPCSGRNLCEPQPGSESISQNAPGNPSDNPVFPATPCNQIQRCALFLN